MDTTTEETSGAMALERQPPGDVDLDAGHASSTTVSPAAAPSGVTDDIAAPQVGQSTTLSATTTPVSVASTTIAATSLVAPSVPDPIPTPFSTATTTLQETAPPPTVQPIATATPAAAHAAVAAAAATPLTNRLPPTTLATNPPTAQLSATPALPQALAQPAPGLSNAMPMNTSQDTSSLKRPFLSVDVTCPSSPRKSKRMRLATPKGQELDLQRAAAVGAPRSIILTHSQAIMKNKKLPKGYRLVPVSMLDNNGTDVAAVEANTRKRKVTRQATGQVAGPNGVNAFPPAPMNRPLPVARKGRRGGKNSEQLAHEQKQARIALLKKRLQLLKARQAHMASNPATSALPAPSPISTSSAKRGKKGSRGGTTPRTPAAFPSHSTNPPAPSPPAASPYTPVARGHTPQNFASTPLTPGEGKSRSGRVVKAPKFLTADDTVPVKLPEQLRHCRTVLAHMMQQKFSHVFGEAVDPVRLNIPDYFKVVKHPMDLGTVKACLNRGDYLDPEVFARDVRLVWSNAMLYNPKGSFFHNIASEYSQLFEKKLAKELAKTPRHSTPRASTAKTPRSRAAGSTAKKPPAKGDSTVLKQMEGLKDTIVNLQQMVTNLSKKGSVTPSQPSAAARKRQSLDQTPLTVKEKQELKRDIFKLPAQKLQPVVEMCSRNSGSTDQNEDEIEIDIDKLDIPTLRELQRYVKRVLANQNRKKRTGKTPTPSRSPAVTPGRGGRGASPAIVHPSPSQPPLEPANSYSTPSQPPSQFHSNSTPSQYNQPMTNNQYTPTNQYNQQNYHTPMQPPAAPPAAPPSASPKSSSDSGSSDSDSDSDSSDSDDAKPAAKAAPPQQAPAHYQQPPPYQQQQSHFAAPPPASFGDASMYSTAPLGGMRQAQPGAAPSAAMMDVSKVVRY